MDGDSNGRTRFRSAMSWLQNCDLSKP